MNALLDAALELAARGRLVMPLRPGTKQPATVHGFKDATTDPSVIRQWWACWPRANVGIRTGMGTGIVVLDIDPPVGYRSLEQLISTHGPLPEGPTVSTPRDGRHHYFAHPGGITVPNSAGKLGMGLDVRGDGGYVVAPPSVVGARGYSWHGRATELPPCPRWLLDALRPPVPPAIARRRLVVLPGGRYAASALQGELDRVRTAAKGARNDTLNRAAFALGTLVGSGVLDAGLAGRALLDAALEAGLGEVESRGTILSGLNKGAASPRHGVSA